MAKVARIWCKKRDTNQVFQVTKMIAEREPPRIGVDLIMISEAEARKLQKQSADEKRQAAIDRRQAPVSKALAKLQLRQADVEFETAERAKLDAAIAAQQLASDQPHADVSGDPTPAASTLAAATDPNAVPETPEQVQARLDAQEAAGADGETGVVPDGYRDGLEEKSRPELYAVIDELKERGGDIKKQGTNAAIIAAIRATVPLVEAAEAEAVRQAEAAE